MTTFRPGITNSATRGVGSAPAHERPHYPALDGIRALAFLMVFATHYLALPWGWAGVDIFFVLSGFLITGILYDTRHQPQRVYNFYLRRTLRIFPLYYGLLALILLADPIVHWDCDSNWLLWPAYLGNFARSWHAIQPMTPLWRLAEAKLFSQRFPQLELVMGHFWSLCVEEQFYLVWPGIVFWIADRYGIQARRKLLYLCLASVLLGPLLRMGAGHFMPWWQWQQETLYRVTPFRVDALLLGGATALIQRGRFAARMLSVARMVFATLGGGVLVWFIVSPVAHHAPEGYNYPHAEFTWALSVIDLLAACLIVMALDARSITARVFSDSRLRWLGGISYGAYIFHDIPHVMLLSAFAPITPHRRLAVAACAFALTIPMAWASYRWFELPFIRMKHRLTRRPATVEMSVVAGS